MKKLIYEQPTAEFFEVLFDESLLQGGSGNAGGDDTIVDDDNDY